MITFKNGIFFDKAGEIVPLEFGNKEQIQLIERIQNLKSEGEEIYATPVLDTGIMEDVEKVMYIFRCPCGARIQREYTYEQNNELTTENCNCFICKNKYILQATERTDYVLIKLLKP